MKKITFVVKLYFLRPAVMAPRALYVYSAGEEARQVVQVIKLIDI